MKVNCCEKPESDHPLYNLWCDEPALFDLVTGIQDMMDHHVTADLPLGFWSRIGSLLGGFYAGNIRKDMSKPLSEANSERWKQYTKTREAEEREAALKLVVASQSETLAWLNTNFVLRLPPEFAQELMNKLHPPAPIVEADDNNSDD